MDELRHKIRKVISSYVTNSVARQSKFKGFHHAYAFFWPENGRMKSQQVKCLLSACNPLFLFTPCSALIDLRRCYRLFKVIVAKKACPVIVHSIYIPFKLVEDPNSTALSGVK